MQQPVGPICATIWWMETLYAYCSFGLELTQILHSSAWIDHANLTLKSVPLAIIFHYSISGTEIGHGWPFKPSQTPNPLRIVMLPGGPTCSMFRSGMTVPENDSNIYLHGHVCARLFMGRFSCLCIHCYWFDSFNLFFLWFLESEQV